MKISEAAKKYLREKKITNLFFVPKSVINYYGCSCVGGTRMEVEAEVRWDLESDDSYELFEDEEFKIFVKKRIIKGVNDKTLIDYKSGLFGDKIVVEGFESEKVKETKVIA